MAKPPTVDNLERWKERCAAIPQAVREEILATLHQNADEFAGRLHTNIPKESGALDTTIRVKYGDGQGSTVSDKALTATVSVGDAAHPYAAPLEFGHMDGGTHVPPEPFFFPLLRVIRKRLRSRMRRAIQKAVAAFAGGQ